VGTNEHGQVIKYVRGKDETALKKSGGRWHLKLAGEQPVPVAELKVFFEEAADAVETMSKLKSEYVEWRVAEIQSQILERIAMQPPITTGGSNVLSRLFGNVENKA
jgi:hypothetical protein